MALGGGISLSAGDDRDEQNPGRPGYIRSGTKINIQAVRRTAGANEAGEARPMLPLG